MENTNPNQHSPNEGSRPDQKQPANFFQQKRIRIPVILIGITVLLAAVMATFSYKYKQVPPFVSSEPPQSPNNTVVATTAPYLIPIPKTSSSTAQGYSSGNYIDESFALGSCQNSLPVIASQSGLVQWVEPRYLDNTQIFSSGSESADYVGGEADYLVGHILSGKYQGGDILLVTIPYPGMSGSEGYDHIVRLNGKYYFLTKYSEDRLVTKTSSDSNIDLTEDLTFDMEDLDLPQIIHMDSPSANYSEVNWFGFSQFNDVRFCGDGKTLVFKDPKVGNVYSANPETTAYAGLDSSSSSSSLYIKAPDSTQRVYIFHPDIMGENDSALVTWSNGTNNTQKYTYQNMTGCGPQAFVDIANVKLSDLKQAGTGLNSQQIYEYKNLNDPGLKNIYDKMWVPENSTKPSYQTFLSNHPVFFWQDPFGDFVRFINEQYEQEAYCG